MKELKILLVVCVGLFGCAKEDHHFWYPIALKSASCGTFEGDVYVMTNSVGWRSWVYTLDPTDNTEIELPSTCTFKLKRSMPTYKASREQNVRQQLNKEQRAHVVEGF